MKVTKCKRCDAEGVFWMQRGSGKWQLSCSVTGKPHYCDDGKLKAVKCKYCSADDLHWAEEIIDAHTKQKKVVLTESYGLPHACDERLNFLAKEKQEKKDKYEAEKLRINEQLNGPCSLCKGTGSALIGTVYSICVNCHGYGQFSATNRKTILADVRRKIWPNMDRVKREW